MEQLRIDAGRLERQVVHRVAPYQERLLRVSIDLLRIALGLVFLVFGALKFVPGLSPAEEIATRAMHGLSFGLMPDGLGLIFVALMETAIGLSLVTGRYLRLGLALLAMAMVGVLSPLVLFPGELFAGPLFAPTLTGQYVLKDIVLLAAALVVSVSALGRRAASAPNVEPASGIAGREASARQFAYGQSARRLEEAA